MIYYLFWVDLLCISVLLSVAVFLWLQMSGQISRQDRARFLPLAGEDFAPMPPPPKLRSQWIAMFAMLLLGFLVMLGGFCVALR